MGIGATETNKTVKKNRGNSEEWGFIIPISYQDASLSRGLKEERGWALFLSAVQQYKGPKGPRHAGNVQGAAGSWYGQSRVTKGREDTMSQN